MSLEFWQVWQLYFVSESLSSHLVHDTIIGNLEESVVQESIVYYLP